MPRPMTNAVVKVYFMQRPDGVIKIDSSKQPRRKEAVAQAKTGVKLKLLGCLPKKSLAFVHMKFHGLRLPGNDKWFEPGEALLEYIYEECNQETCARDFGYRTYARKVPTVIRFSVTRIRELPESGSMYQFARVLGVQDSQVSRWIHRDGLPADIWRDSWQPRYTLHRAQVVPWFVERGYFVIDQTTDALENYL